MQKINLQKNKACLAKFHRSRGFTLIETMISISIFLIVIFYGISALVSVNLVGNKAQNMRSIIDGLSFIMEDMSRNLKTGFNYRCVTDANFSVNISEPQTCSFGRAIIFEEATGDELDDGDQWIFNMSSDGVIFKSIDGGATFMQLSPDEIVLSPKSGFVVSGAEPAVANSQQPIVTIRLIGYINNKNVVTPFSLQATASQRFVKKNN